ncbi:signal-induced proliferation-associated 1-like protein 1 isoform X2 [Denticeps clupeoides]|uniref:Signal-induced proliferation-associated 1-like protein 1 n=1 Tax=Denticeps clupeoides TaxID=299321 RepID=A0AAY4BJY7_9TELE|nr:signal-induced proliferation-associated 1-like protein 1 isoform X2 [Denticeps clupeoides]
MVGGSVPASDEFYSRHLHLTNWVTPHLSCSESSYSTLAGMLGVPKMGVRARVADWPPRREGGGGIWPVTSETAPPSHSGGGGRGLVGGSGGPIKLLSPQDTVMLHNIHTTLKNRTQVVGLMTGVSLSTSSAGTTTDPRFLSAADYQGPKHRGARRIRQRSNSDITLSELDGSGDSADDWGSVGTKWSPLHREYGSTSSIDQHGIPASSSTGESFFEMLKGYQGTKLDQRSPAPDRLDELLRSGHKQDLLELTEYSKDGQVPTRLRDRNKHPKRRSKSETGGDSIFRKLRNVRAETDSPRACSDVEDGRTEDCGPPLRPWLCQKGFAHYDVQSLLFDLNDVIRSQQTSAARRKNTTTGASAAAVAASTSASSTLSSTHSLPYSSPSGSQEELSCRDDLTDSQGNELVQCCPYFRTEIGADFRLRPAVHDGAASLASFVGDSGSLEVPMSLHSTNSGVAVLEGQKDAPNALNDRNKQYIVEHVDLGAYYYRKYFYLREHWNYFGLDEALGPVAVSLRREKLEDDKEHGPQYNFRVIFRTSELMTLRGSLLEDVVPSSAKHGTARGLPLKEVLEYLVPELDVPCLRLALNTPKVTEQLMKLDEQGLSFQVKVGVMYCRAGQSTEEEMYNNETAGAALDEFLQLLGDKVRLKGFNKYRAQLDTKTDSTGTHSLYTAYKDYEIMFHVSTMLPYTPNNKQQLLRKRHIGNDIVTIVFQEPGALPFTPKNIRSHFQHVFIVVRVHNPCCDATCYSVAVTRSRDVPFFGPPIPKGVTFPKSTVFRDFLLAKVINAENAAHKSDKFRAMATRTRQEYLRDLAERHVTTTPVEPMGKFPFISLAPKRRERSRPYGGAELRSLGAVTWSVHAEDPAAGAERECLLAISNEFVVLVDQGAKAVVFNCSVRDVIGWSSGSPASMKIYYERGESVSLRSVNNNTEDFSEVVKRLELLTKGSQTTEMTLRRNALGQLGFHVNFEGIVAEVEPYGYAWQAGLRQGSRLVEICKVSVATLSHEQMIDLLRTSVTVKVVIIPPHEDSTPRRGCSEMYHLPLVDYKNHKEGMPYELKFPFRNTSSKWQRTTSSPQQTVGSSAHGRGMGTLIKAPGSDYTERTTAIPRSVSSDGRPLNPKRYSPGSDNYALACSIVMGRSPHTRSSPNSNSYSSNSNTSSTAHWRQKSMPEGFNANRSSPLTAERQNPNEAVNGVKVTPCWGRVVQGEGTTAADRSTADLSGPKAKPVVGSSEQQDPGTILSANKNTKVEAPYSSQSSSNTLSSNASSSVHSDEKWYESCRAGGHTETELNGFGAGYLQGASTDSGIDASSYAATLSSSASLSIPPLFGSSKSKEKSFSAWNEPSLGGRKATEIPSPPAESPFPSADGTDGQAKSPAAYNIAPDNSSYTLSDATSHSSTLSSGLSDSPMGSAQDDPGAATSPTCQTSLYPGPKSFYPRQGATSKYLIGWKKPGGTINPVDFTATRKRHQSDGHLGGQPQLRATMRVTQSPQHIPKSSLQEDLKKLIALDSPPPVSQEFRPVFKGSNPSRRSLQRTLSDESVYSRQRELVSVMPSDALFSCSTMPRSPTARCSSQCQPSYTQAAKSLGDLTSSDPVFDQEWCRRPLQDTTLMPLPDANADTGLHWSDLVDAAKAFEAQRAKLLAAKEANAKLELAASSSQQAEPQAAPQRHPSPGETPACLMGKVSHLESMLKLLQEDLKKEKDAKMSLQAQIQSLREDNQRLQEESHHASAKLKKFTEWVFNTIDMN